MHDSCASYNRFGIIIAIEIIKILAQLFQAGIIVFSMYYSVIIVVKSITMNAIKSQVF